MYRLNGNRHSAEETEAAARMSGRGRLEAQLSDAIVKFEREYLGRGPVEARSYLVADMAIVRLKEVLTPAEKHLAQTEDPARGRRLIKEMRSELLESSRALLEAVVKEITGRGVVSMHTDISTRVGERVIIFTLDGEPEGMS